MALLRHASPSVLALSLAAFTLLSSDAVVMAQSSPSCHFLGPVFQPPSAAHASPSFQTAISQLNDTLHELSRNGTIRDAETAIHIQAFSGDEKLLSFGFAPPSMAESLTSGTVDENTIFRIGSISKLFTVYTLLAETGIDHLDDPVTKWVPQLANAAEDSEGHLVENAQWDGITLRALASHMSGISRDSALVDLVQSFEHQGLNDTAIRELGLPILAEEEKPTCGAFNHDFEPCSREEFLDQLLSLRPATSSFNTPIYSNLGPRILSLAMEGITGSPFPELLNRSLLHPLGMTRTILDAPSTEENAVIPEPRIESWWDIPLGGDSASGGVFSTASDMTRFAQSILNSELLSPALTRAWFKPVSNTADLFGSSGMPWQIRRMLLPFSPGSNNTRATEILMSSGGIGAYRALLIMSPDHKIGFTMLFASLSPRAGLVSILPDLITEALVAAAEEAAREEAAARFAGKYEGCEGGMSLTLEVEDGLPGLGVTSWTRGDDDMLSLLGSLRFGPGAVARLRLYPMDLEDTKQVGFRGVYEPVGVDSTVRSGIFGGVCGVWGGVEPVKYGNIGIDEFAFILDEDGKVTGLSPLVMRQTLTKVVE